MDGSVVHTWDLGSASPYFVRPLPGGRVLVITAQEHAVLELDWDGNLLWIHYDPNIEMHHDCQRLENGNTLILGRHELLLPRINPLPITYDFLFEVQPNHDVVWLWHSAMHFNEFGFDRFAKQSIYKSTWDDSSKWHTGYRDLFHTNSIQALPANRNDTDPRFRQGNILMSQRHTNIVFIIDRDSGAVVWKIGPQDYITIGQHDAQMIEEGLPGAGNILIFDNGSDAGYPKKSKNISRVVEIDPVSKEIVWEYNDTLAGRPIWCFSSDRISGCQRLPNGNTLINEGLYGRFFEVTVEGEIVWEYVHANPPVNVYRVYRVAPDWIP
jgi:hypothetical protein